MVPNLTLNRVENRNGLRKIKMKPIILEEGKYTKNDLEKIKKQNKIWKIIDIYNQQLKELFEINNPSLKVPKDIQKRSEGNWIYFPWNGYLIHTVCEKDYFILRTNRNKNLITKSEQEKLSKVCIGIIGLSVGSATALNLTYLGIGNTFKLAEFDNLETTNLNRIKAGLHQVGLPKVDIASEQIYEINPYIKLELFPKGLTKDNLEKFFQDPIPQIIFEIIDDFEIKILIRQKARKLGIPVIMPANLGDSVLIDIERFDLDKSLPLFNGAIGDLPEKILENPLEDRNKYAVQIVGLENIPKRAIESVKEIGKTLVGRPQLSSTVTISSGILSYLAKSIVLGENISSGRYRIAFEDFFK